MADVAKRFTILEAIKKGGATKESLMDLAKVDEKGLASQLTYLRMSGQYPVKGSDGIYTLSTAEDWAAKRATVGTGAATVTLSPAERLARAEKRSKRAASAYDAAKAKKDANPNDRVSELNFIKAEAELEIAEIMLGRAQAEAPVGTVVVNEADPDGVEADSEGVEEEFESDIDPDDLEDEFA
jgi:hypothetical protein